MNEMSMGSDNENGQRKPQKPEKPGQAWVLIMKISPGARSSARTVPTLLSILYKGWPIS